MELVSQRAYARSRGRSHTSVQKLIAEGKIPTHGPKKQLNPAEADRAIAGNLDPAQVTAGNSKAGNGATANGYAKARTEQIRLKAERERFELDRLRGLLVDRDRATQQAFAFARGFRDAVLNWPARVGAEIAAEVGADQQALIVTLERHVRALLTEIADQRFDLG